MSEKSQTTKLTLESGEGKSELRQEGSRCWSGGSQCACAVEQPGRSELFLFSAHRRITALLLRTDHDFGLFLSSIQESYLQQPGS